MIWQLNPNCDKSLSPSYRAEVWEWWKVSTACTVIRTFQEVPVSSVSECGCKMQIGSALSSPMPHRWGQTYAQFWLLQRPDHHKTPKKQNSRLEFPAYLLVAISSHWPVKRLFFLISDICENKERLREKPFVQTSVQIFSSDRSE